MEVPSRAIPAIRQFTSAMPDRVEGGSTKIELKLGPCSAPKTTCSGEIRKQRSLLESLDGFLRVASLQLDQDQDRSSKDYKR